MSCSPDTISLRNLYPVGKVAVSVAAQEIPVVPAPDKSSDDSTNSAPCSPHDDYLEPSSPGSSWYDPTSDERSITQKRAHPTTDNHNSEGEQSK